MPEALSPLGSAWKPGRHGAPGTLGVTLTETRPGSIVQVGAWRGSENSVRLLIAARTGLDLPPTPGAGVVNGPRAGFGIGPARFLLIDQAEGLGADLAAAISSELGKVTDLSHGRTAIRVAGPKAEWVLAKLFAIDFAARSFPVGAGRATQHHDVFAAIQRTAADAFDLYVFRSFARSFWTTLCHAAEETGYEVR